MKIVLDESVPQKLRLLLEGGNSCCSVVPGMVWTAERQTAACSRRSGLRSSYHCKSIASLSAKSDRPKVGVAGVEYK
jgi:hypothetical protein